MTLSIQCTPIMLYVLVLLGSGPGIAGVAVASKKRKRNEKAKDKSNEKARESAEKHHGNDYCFP